MEKRLMTFLACLLLSVGLAMAQTKVTGVVTSAEDGEPVVGASVKVVGTNTGTITNTDGKFSLQAPQGSSRLEVSYIGMQTKTVKIAPELKIVLSPEDNALDEVMVVAFGTAKKSAFTGSASVVDSKELSKKVTTNVADALVGSVAGLQIRSQSGSPGSSSTSGINIRGIASMYASTTPLVIVDGAPFPGNLSSIPSDDIESVTVLKDAASAALYGARGAAGVIIITTKTGKNRDAEISVDMKWGANSRAIQDYDVITDPGQYYEAVYSAIYNRQFYGNGLSAADANSRANTLMLNYLAYNVYTLPEGESLIGMDGKLNSKATLGRKYDYNGATYYMTADDWNDAAYSTALRQEYNVSAKGAYDRGNFYLSMGYLNDDGIIDKSSYERISARVKADYQAKRWLKLGVNAQYVNSTTESSPNLSTSMGAANIMYYTSRIAPIYPIYVRKVDGNGNVYIDTDSYGHKKFDYGVASNGYGVTRPFMATGNPLGSNLYNEYKQGMNQLNGNVFADISFTDWLKLNITSSVTYNVFNINDYTNSFEGPSAGAGGTLKKSDTANLRTNNVQTLTFMKSFGKHNVDALVGHEYYKANVKYLEGDARAEFSPYLQELYAYANKYDNTSYQTNYNVEGFFGRAQYNYDEKYFGSLSYRRDASSYFSKDNRWGSFWSVGGAWLISKESWFNAPFVNELKLKASIGQQGNDNIGMFAYTDLYTLSASSTTSMSPSFYRMGNNNITWEKTTNLNVGVEFSLLNRRLTGSFDFYSKKTTDLLFWLSIPESQGSRGYYGNLGDIRNMGVELVLTGTLVRTKDIDWSVTANLSHNSTKVLKLPESKIKDNGGFSESVSSAIFSCWYREGGPLYNAYMPEYAGVNEQGLALYWVDEEVDPLTSSNSRGTTPGYKHTTTTTDYSKASYYEQGSMLPKVFGGFSTSFRYKGFDASATFDYQIGGKVYDQQYATLMANPYTSASNYGAAIHKDWVKSWSPDNTQSSVPRWYYGDSYQTSRSTRFLTNAGYLNFQAFSVGYTLPKGLIPQVSKIRIYCMGENLCFWSARKGLDPRYAYEGSQYVSNYSPTRNITGGVQVTF